MRQSITAFNSINYTLKCCRCSMFHYCNCYFFYLDNELITGNLHYTKWMTSERQHMQCNTYQRKNAMEFFFQIPILNQWPIFNYVCSLMAPAIRYYFNQNSGDIIYAYILPAYLERFQMSYVVRRKVAPSSRPSGHFGCRFGFCASFDFI